MNIDLKSTAIGLGLGLVAWGGWYAGSTRPVIGKLVEEKANAINRANQFEQESAKYKGLAEHWFAVANSQPQSAVQSQQLPQDPAVAMLNGIRPGLGTLAAAANQAWQQHQAQQRQAQQRLVAQDEPKCPAGQLPHRFVNQPWTCEVDSEAGAVQPPQVSTAISAACKRNELLINGECLPCGSGLHPGYFPNGSAGCVR
jgi:hypothetical protein